MVLAPPHPGSSASSSAHAASPSPLRTAATLRVMSALDAVLLRAPEEGTGLIEADVPAMRQGRVIAPVGELPLVCCALVDALGAVGDAPPAAASEAAPAADTNMA